MKHYFKRGLKEKFRSFFRLSRYHLFPTYAAHRWSLLNHVKKLPIIHVDILITYYMCNNGLNVCFKHSIVGNIKIGILSMYPALVIELFSKGTYDDNIRTVSSDRL